MGDSFISALTKSCRLGLKSKVIGHLSGCIGATCVAQGLKVNSMDSSMRGACLLRVTLSTGEPNQNGLK